jgi:hypothetical protein
MFEQAGDNSRMGRSISMVVPMLLGGAMHTSVLITEQQYAVLSLSLDLDKVHHHSSSRSRRRRRSSRNNSNGSVSKIGMLLGAMNAAVAEERASSSSSSSSAFSSMKMAIGASVG